jgi:hypothetical protein
VNKNKTASLDELKNRIRSGNPVFFGATINGGGGDALNDIIASQYKLENNIKELKYKNAGEISTALINGEIDYTILSQGYIRIADIRPLVISAKKRSTHQLLSHIPTGEEVGIDRFVFSAQAFFGITKELQELGSTLIPYIEKVCENQQIKDLKAKTGQDSNCDSPDIILKNIAEELELINSVVR